MADTYLNPIHPLLIVNDVAETCEFYRSKLGFDYLFPALATAHLEGDFAMLRRDGVILMFKAVENGKPRPNHTIHEWVRHDAFIPVNNLEELCEEFRSKGVKIVEDIHESEWGTREFYFEDNNGYVFCCGHTTSASKPQGSAT